MSRKLSFWLFIGVLLVVGIYFFRIVQPFLFPLLIATVLAILFRPFYEKVVAVLRGHDRWAAVLTTAVVLLVVVLPVALGGYFAAQELVGVANTLVTDSPEPNVSESGQPRRPADEQRPAAQEAAAGNLLAVEKIPAASRMMRAVEPYLSAQDLDQLKRSALGMAQTLLTEIYNRSATLLANLFQFVVGFAVMALALYYFFADGPAMLKNIQSLVPLESYEEELVFKQFESVCRGVVLGTILSAFVQAGLLGIGLALTGMQHVWLLMGLTILVSLIPFVGAAGVYVPVAIYFVWNGQYWTAAALLAYGALVVSSSDNLVRAYVIHGSSRLHPLVALVSVLGALSLVGVWGVFVGPVVAGIFYAMLTILQQKLRRMEETPAAARAEQNTIKSTEDPFRALSPSRVLTET